MNEALRDQALNLSEDERFDLMMALFDSLSDAELPIFSVARICDLQKLVERYSEHPEPSVAYAKVVERLRLRGLSEL
jgi:hypothetical protein